MRIVISFIVTAFLHLIRGVGGECNVSVNGGPVMVVEPNGLGSNILYKYETVSEEGKTLDIVFINFLDSWSHSRLQSFSIKDFKPYVTCNKTNGPTCPFLFNYSVPLLIHRNRPTRKRESIAVSTENREICLLDIITASKGEEIEFNLQWLHQEEFHELVVEITAGFPGPITIDQPTCGDVPVHNTSKGAFLVFSHDLKPNVQCSVTVRGRTSADVKNQTIALPISPKSTKSQPVPPTTSNTPFVATIVVLACFLALLFLTMGIYCFYTRKSQQITVNNYIEKGFTADHDSKPEYSPSGGSSIHSLTDGSCDESDELETDGPISKPSTSLRDANSQPATASFVAGQSQSTSVTVHATQVDDSFTFNKAQELDEHRV